VQEFASIGLTYAYKPRMGLAAFGSGIAQTEEVEDEQWRQNAGALLHDIHPMETKS
jgi:hypothetical protein